MDSDFKKKDRASNKKLPRTWDDHPYPMKQSIDWELKMFMLWYNGRRPAWDFIQYLIKTKLI